MDNPAIPALMVSLDATAIKEVDKITTHPSSSVRMLFQLFIKVLIKVKTLKVIKKLKLCISF